MFDQMAVCQFLCDKYVLTTSDTHIACGFKCSCPCPCLPPLTWLCMAVIHADARPSLRANHFAQLSILFGTFVWQQGLRNFTAPRTWKTLISSLAEHRRTWISHQERVLSVDQHPWNQPIPSDLEIRPNRIGIVSLCDYDGAMTEITSLSAANKLMYSHTYGYRNFFHTRSNPDRPPAWSKVRRYACVYLRGRMVAMMVQRLRTLHQLHLLHEWLCRFCASTAVVGIETFR